MFQPYKEKNLTLQISQKIKINNLSFYIRKFSLHWQDDDFYITAWGSEPNATTFHSSRVIRYDGLIWRPEKNGITFFTVDGKSFDSLSMDEDQCKSLIKEINEGTEEITNCWINMTTAVNDPIHYDFERES